MLEAVVEVGIRCLLAGPKERVAEQWLRHWPLFCTLDFSPGSAACRILWDLLSLHKPHLLTFSLSSPLFLIYVYGPSTRRGASPFPVGCKSACKEMPHYHLVGFHSPPGLSSLVPCRTVICSTCQTEQKLQRKRLLAVPMKA